MSTCLFDESKKGACFALGGHLSFEDSYFPDDANCQTDWPTKEDSSHVETEQITKTMCPEAYIGHGFSIDDFALPNWKWYVDKRRNQFVMVNGEEKNRVQLDADWRAQEVFKLTGQWCPTKK